VATGGGGVCVKKEQEASNPRMREGKTRSKMCPQPPGSHDRDKGGRSCAKEKKKKYEGRSGRREKKKDGRPAFQPGKREKL